MRDSLVGRRARVVAILLAVGTVATGLSAREVRPSDTRPVAAVTKILHFPRDQSLGVLAVLKDLRALEHMDFWTATTSTN